MSTADDITGEGVKAIVEAARGVRDPKILDAAVGVDLDGVALASVPLAFLPVAGGGMKTESVFEEVKKYRAEFATRPVRREGIATLEEIGAFVEHANRFKDGGSAIFVTGGATSPRFTSVLDYHPAGEAKTVDPRFGRHRGHYAPAFSPEWKAWQAVDGKALSQPLFAALITDNVRCILDVTDVTDLGELAGWFALKHGRKVGPVAFYADSGRMLDLAEGLTISMNERVTDVARRDTGETSIQFDAKAETSVAGVAVTIPVAFVLELPIFVGGARYQMPVRLRLTTYLDGDVKRARWTIAIFGGAESVLACVADMRAQVVKETGLPVFAGSPE